MSRRSGAADEEDPDVGIKLRVLEMASPSQIMECRFRGVTKLQPNLVGYQRVKTCTLVDFIEVRQRFSGKEFFTGRFMVDRRPIDVVQQSLGQI